MKIRNMIEALERRAELNKDGLDAELKVAIYPGIHTSSCVREVTIDDVSGVWGQGVDEIYIDIMPSLEVLEFLYTRGLKLKKYYEDYED